VVNLRILLPGDMLGDNVAMKSEGAAAGLQRLTLCCVVMNVTVGGR